MTIQIHYPPYAEDRFEVPVFKTFSAGEEHVNLKKREDVAFGRTIVLTARIRSSKELMQTLLVTDALRGLYPGNPIQLFLPYLPYSRQDRACAPGDAFSLCVLASLLNAQDYKFVSTVDAHNESVAETLIANFVSIPQHEQASFVYAELFSKTHEANLGWIVAPDKGASEKASLWLNETLRLAQGSKQRDPSNGAILGLDIDIADFEGKDALIVDDICDGGRTFIELTKLLKARNVGRVYLYVTHGIFSQGIAPLLESGIHHIFTTDSFPQVAYPTLTVVRRFFHPEIL